MDLIESVIIIKTVGIVKWGILGHLALDQIKFLTLDTNLYALMYKFVVEPRRMCVALVLPYFY